MIGLPFRTPVDPVQALRTLRRGDTKACKRIGERGSRQAIEELVLPSCPVALGRTRAARAEGEGDNGWQPLPFVTETRIDSTWTQDTTIDRILHDLHEPEHQDQRAPG